MDTLSPTVSFVVSSSHETFVKENRRFWGGGYRRIGVQMSGERSPQSRRRGLANNLAAAPIAKGEMGQAARPSGFEPLGKAALKIPPPPTGSLGPQRELLRTSAPQGQTQPRPLLFFAAYPAIPKRTRVACFNCTKAQTAKEQGRPIRASDTEPQQNKKSPQPCRGLSHCPSQSL